MLYSLNSKILNNLLNLLLPIYAYYNLEYTAFYSYIATCTVLINKPTFIALRTALPIYCLFIIFSFSFSASYNLQYLTHLGAKPLYYTLE